MSTHYKKIIILQLSYATNFQLHATHSISKPHSCIKQVIHDWYVDIIYVMNLYFIRLYYSTMFAHGDMCSFVKVNFTVTHGKFKKPIDYLLIN
jgi:hypothetical protein